MAYGDLPMNTPNTPTPGLMPGLRVEHHREQKSCGPGCTSNTSWSEVVCDRPGNSQVAHCADAEDAEAIVEALLARHCQSASHETLADRNAVLEEAAKIADEIGSDWEGASPNSSGAKAAREIAHSLRALRTQGGKQSSHTADEEDDGLVEIVAEGLWAIGRKSLGRRADFLPSSRTDFREAARERLSATQSSHPLSEMTKLDEEFGLYDDEAVPLSPNATQSSHTDLSADKLFSLIAHGDDEHRAWLKEAIDAAYAGEPVPECRGSGRKEALIADLLEALEKADAELLTRCRQWEGSERGDGLITARGIFQAAIAQHKGQSK